MLAAYRLVILSQAEVVAPTPALPVICSLISKPRTKPSAKVKASPGLKMLTGPAPDKSATPGPAQPNPNVPPPHRRPAEDRLGIRQSAASSAARPIVLLRPAPKNM